MPSPFARRTGRTLRAALALALLVVALLVGPLALPARAEGTVSTFVVNANLNPEGVLRVSQTLTFTGTPPAEVSQRFELREDLVGDRQYVQRLGEVTATAGGTPVTSVEVAPQGRFTTVTVPTNGAREIVMTYDLSGAVVNTQNGPVLRARLLQGLSAAVTEFAATVQVPTQFTYIRCTAGPPNSTEPCDYSAGGTTEAQTPTFRDGPRGPGEVVAVEIGFPPGTITPTEIIERRWTLGRAFSADPLPLALALGLLALGGLALFALHRRAGADTRAGGDIAKPGDFVPVGEGRSEFRVANEIRPGHVGTVVDERVDPIDVTATLLDLAVRGHLVITELPRETEVARTDWLLTRQRGTDELRPFEQALLHGIAPDDQPVRVSQIADRVRASIGDVQDSLYDEVVAAGWYERRPDATRNRWTQLAFTVLVLAVVITGVLIAFTTFGLVGLALIAIGLGLVFVAQEMPSRTAKGSALLAGLGALRSDLLTHPTTQMPPGRELHELSEVLPYAVVLGGTDRWLDAIVASDADADPDPHDLPWYRAPEGWHLRDLPASLRNFVTTVSGTLFSR